MDSDDKANIEERGQGDDECGEDEDVLIAHCAFIFGVQIRQVYHGIATIRWLHMSESNGYGLMVSQAKWNCSYGGLGGTKVD